MGEEHVRFHNIYYAEWSRIVAGTQLARRFAFYGDCIRSERFRTGILTEIDLGPRRCCYCRSVYN